MPTIEEIENCNDIDDLKAAHATALAERQAIDQALLDAKAAKDAAIEVFDNAKLASDDHYNEPDIISCIEQQIGKVTIANT